MCGRTHHKTVKQLSSNETWNRIFLKTNKKEWFIPELSHRVTELKGKELFDENLETGRINRRMDKDDVVYDKY